MLISNSGSEVCSASRVGLPVAGFYLSVNAGLFIMRRCDFTQRGVSMGFEDRCSLQA